jgi:hypothetical protein
MFLRTKWNEGVKTVAATALATAQEGLKLAQTGLASAEGNLVAAEASKQFALKVALVSAVAAALAEAGEQARQVFAKQTTAKTRVQASEEEERQKKNSTAREVFKQDGDAKRDLERAELLNGAVFRTRVRLAPEQREAAMALALQPYGCDGCNAEGEECDGDLPLSTVRELPGEPSQGVGVVGRWFHGIGPHCRDFPGEGAAAVELLCKDLCLSLPYCRGFTFLEPDRDADIPEHRCCFRSRTDRHYAQTGTKCFEARLPRCRACRGCYSSSFLVFTWPGTPCEVPT